MTIQLHRAIRSGWLAVPPNYDDNYYLADSLSRLSEFYEKGFPGLFTSLVDLPVHSPSAFLYAFSGFALFGVHDWAPYVSTFVTVLAGLLVVNLHLDTPARSVAACILVSCLSWLIFGEAVRNIRPDILWGFLLAGAISLILSEEWFTAERRRQILVGVLAGCALLVKPTMAPVSVVAIVAAFGLAYVVLRRHHAGRVSVLQVMPLRALVPMLGIPAIYYALAVGYFVEYLYKVVIAPDADVWLLHDPLSGVDAARYYLTGDGGGLLLGDWLFVTIGVALVAGVIAWISRRPPSWSIVAANALMLVLLYGLVTVPKLKNPVFGATLTAFLLLCYARMLSGATTRLWELKTACGRVLTLISCAALLALSATLFAWPGDVDLERGRQAAKLASMTLDAIHRQQHSATKRVFVTGSALHFNATTLQYEARKRQLDRIDFWDELRTRDLKTVEKLVAASDVVVAFSEGNKLLPQLLASSSVQGPILSLINADRGMKKVVELETSIDGGRIYVYSRPPAFAGFEGSTLAGAESIPALLGQRKERITVRWGIGPETRTRVDVPADGKLLLRARAWGVLADRRVDVMIGATKVGELLVPVEGFVERELAIQAIPGQALVSLQYDDWNRRPQLDPRPLAVLFNRLQLVHGDSLSSVSEVKPKSAR
ncbi:MAG: hypothetical protein ACT4QB_01880 [Gammaproteobacteria bacterium]